jgi:TPR repeat protein
MLMMEDMQGASVSPTSSTLKRVIWLGIGAAVTALACFGWFKVHPVNPKAQFDLGAMYFAGKGRQQDLAEGVRWYRKAAEQGYVKAQSTLGRLYHSGSGVPEDDAQSVYWYRKAAEQGDVDAELQLGLIYEKGEGVPKDFVQAVYWYRKAAEQGYTQAELYLGWMYRRGGEGVPQDEAQGVHWVRKAAEQGLAEAQLSLGLEYLNGEGRALREDLVQAAYWVRKAASQGNQRAKDLVAAPPFSDLPSLETLGEEIHAELRPWVNGGASGPGWVTTAGPILPQFVEHMSQSVGHHYSNGRMFINRNTGVVTLMFDCELYGSAAYLPLIVRLFDENGRYITHFETQERFGLSSHRNGAHPPGAVLEELKSGTNTLQYNINMRDAAYVRQGEFGYFVK